MGKKCIFAEENLKDFRSNNKIINLSDEGTLLYRKLEEQDRRDYQAKDNQENDDYKEKVEYDDE